MAFTIKEQEPLAPHTVFKIGGPARFYIEVDDRADFVAALRTLRELKIPWWVLGAGSNVLISDRGFAGAAVHWNGGAMRVEGNAMITDAPVSMARTVAETIKAGLTGFEWAIGVPGTVGGSVRGNAGCFGGEMKDVVKAISVYNAESGEMEEWSSDAAEFGYRDSIFKHRPELVVLAATLELAQGDPKASGEKVRELTQLRTKTQDIGSQSAGCIFKNIPWTRRDIDREKLLERFPSLAQFNDKPTIPAGFLIDVVGLKGKSIGGATISQRHGNFVVNTGGATAENVIMLIGVAKEYVHRRFGLLLEEEIQLIGF